MDKSKGLQNYAGENNCFLNVGIQILWHLDAFRVRFFDQEKHDHRDGCTFCALKCVFTQYEYAEGNRIPPTALRNSLSMSFKREDRFQIGQLDDAAEALEAILTCLHKEMVGNVPPDEMGKCCLAHNIFGLSIEERVYCEQPNCKAISDPFVSPLFIYYSYVTALREAHARSSSASFARLLQIANSGDRRSCPNENFCKAQCKIGRSILNLPAVFALGIVWETPDPEYDEITSMMNIIDLEIRLGEIFFNLPKDIKYSLRGMICYYGKHYNAYIYNRVRKQWLVFDDTAVREIGPSLADVRELCRRGRFHPSVLFYEIQKNTIPTNFKFPERARTSAVAKPKEAPPPYPGRYQMATTTTPIIPSLPVPAMPTMAVPVMNGSFDMMTFPTVPTHTLHQMDLGQLEMLRQLEQQKLEQQRQLELQKQKQLEQQRQIEQQKLEQQRLEQHKQEQQRQLELQKQKQLEQQKQLEKQKQLEQQRLMEEKKKLELAEQQRLLEQQQQQILQQQSMQVETQPPCYLPTSAYFLPQEAYNGMGNGQYVMPVMMAPTDYSFPAYAPQAVPPVMDEGSRPNMYDIVIDQEVPRQNKYDVPTVTKPVAPVASSGIQPIAPQNIEINERTLYSRSAVPYKQDTSVRDTAYSYSTPSSEYSALNRLLYDTAVDTGPNKQSLYKSQFLTESNWTKVTGRN